MTYCDTFGFERFMFANLMKLHLSIHDKCFIVSLRMDVRQFSGELLVNFKVKFWIF